VLRVRNKININVRQPLAKIILPISNKDEQQAVESVKEIILDEVNVKDVQFVEDDSGIVQKSAKPNFAVLGKKLGKKMKKVAPMVKNLSTEEITDFETTGTLELDLGADGVVRLGSDDIEVMRTGLEGWSVETERGLTVALDTDLTPDLMREGMAREFVNRVQNMRKEADFDVVDRIEIGFDGSSELHEAVNDMRDYIRKETLAESIKDDELEVADFTKTWEIGEEDCVITIRRNPNS